MPAIIYFFYAPFVSNEAVVTFPEKVALQVRFKKREKTNKNIPNLTNAINRMLKGNLKVKTQVYFLKLI